MRGAQGLRPILSPTTVMVLASANGVNYAVVPTPESATWRLKNAKQLLTTHTTDLYNTVSERSKRRLCALGNNPRPSTGRVK